MFSGGIVNPYDDIVVKATDENLTSENWEIIMNLCDKVQEEGTEGARNVIAAILKRLAHRNPNVQLYALSLAESLSKNLGVELHREIASKAFTQGLEKLATDRTTHDKVKRRVLSLVAMWTEEFEKDTSLGVIEDCYNSLRAKGHKFETPQEPLPPSVDDEIRRKEEEELQRVLEMSMQDKGGRGQWSAYSTVASSGAGGSGSSPSTMQAPRSLQLQLQLQPQPQQQQQQTRPLVSASSSPSPSSTVGGVMHTQGTIVTRVRALHTFEPTEPGELGFEKGDIIKVVDRGYKDWWRGQLKGRTGIFPVNYVETMPEPTPAELAREAEQEAAVFAQAVNVERLLTMLRSLDPAKDNLADNEEIQELYRSSMTLRPKIVKLIDKYSQKRADLVSMNETFVRARSIFERMMEESLARHTGVVYLPENYSAQQYWAPNGYAAFPAPSHPIPLSAGQPVGSVHAQAAAQPQAVQHQGAPLYVFNPATVYSDPNVQAWAQYYAKGGRDPQGGVYFVSVPGVKAASASSIAGPEPQEQQGHNLEPQSLQAHADEIQQHHQGQPQIMKVQPVQVQQTSLRKQTSVTSIDLPYPGDYAQASQVPLLGSQSFISLNPHETGQPFMQQGQPEYDHHQLHSPVQADASTSNTLVTGTPSWVLPKSVSTEHINGGNAPMAYHGITRQFSDINMGAMGDAGP